MNWYIGDTIPFVKIWENVKLVHFLGWCNVYGKSGVDDTTQSPSMFEDFTDTVHEDICIPCNWIIVQLPPTLISWIQVTWPWFGVRGDWPVVEFYHNLSHEIVTKEREEWYVVRVTRHVNGLDPLLLVVLILGCLWSWSTVAYGLDPRLLVVLIQCYLPFPDCPT